MYPHHCVPFTSKTTAICESQLAVRVSHCQYPLFGTAHFACMKSWSQLVGIEACAGDLLGCMYTPVSLLKY